MAFKTILVVIPPAEIDVRLNLALAIARAQAGTVVALHLVPVVAAVTGDLPPDIVEGRNASLRDGARAAEELVRGRAETAGVPLAWHIEEGDEIAIARQEAQLCDLAVVGPDLARDLVFAGGAPVLAVPPSAGAARPRRIMIAWDAGSEASRAVRDALPLLATADAVCAVAIDPPEGRDTLRELAVFLRRHGISVETHRRKSGSTGTGRQLLNEAKILGADLLIMGAYGHSRFRQWVLGGATEEIFTLSRIPVLLSH
jgi:nucleotide-binding universal stress UspA family protein